MKRIQHGMTLVEVLVAVAIGLIGILIITQAYISSDSFNRSTLGEGGAQTNGTIALYTVQRDLRMSGYGMADSRALACGNINYYYNGAYSANQAGGTLPNLNLAPVTITTSAGAPDTITIMYSSDATRMVPGTLTKPMPSPSAELNVDGTAGFQSGDVVLLVSDTSPVTCTMEQITTVQTSASKIQHNSGGSAPYNPPGGGSFPAYSSNSLVFNLGNPLVHSYSVVKTDPTCTTGCQATLRLTDMQGGGSTPYDLLDGIVDLKAQYGKDNGVNNGTVSQTVYAANDGIIDSYDSTTPATATEWQQVLSIRLAVLARVGNYVKPPTAGGNCTATTAMPTWSGSASGAAFGAIDVATSSSQDRCYKYRVFETVVPLRNMIWRVS